MEFYASNFYKLFTWSRGVVVNMPLCHRGDRQFEFGRDRHCGVEQRSARQPHKLEVVGSNPTAVTRR